MKVSVVIITYNQEKYIAQALDGVVQQETTFPFEVIVADDCSTDDTLLICKDYEKKYPFFRIERSDSNIGYSQNWARALSLATSEYLAIFEGDDYWTDPLKLQKQVEVLDLNKGKGLCYTNCAVYDERDLSQIELDYEKNKINTKNPIFENQFYCGNATWMFRAECIKNIVVPNNCTDVPLLLFYEICLSSDLIFLPIKSAMYRLHQDSFSSEKNKKNVYNYSRNVFLMQRKYVLEFEQSVTNEERLFLKALITLYPTAQKENDLVVINAIEDFFCNSHLEEIFEFVKKQRQREYSLLESNSFKLGHYILFPFHVLKKVVKNVFF